MTLEEEGSSGSHEERPGRWIRFRSSKNAQALHNVVKFNWEMLPAAGGESRLWASKVLLVDEHGRILCDYQFIESAGRSGSDGDRLDPARPVRVRGCRAALGRWRGTPASRQRALNAATSTARHRSSFASSIPRPSARLSMSSPGIACVGALSECSRRGHERCDPRIELRGDHARGVRPNLDEAPSSTAVSASARAPCRPL